MAIPTDFKGFTPSAGTTKTFKILGSATVGIWACDVDGTLSATSSKIELGPNLILFFDQAYTDAEIIALVKDWLGRMGAFHEGPGGGKTDLSRQLPFTGVTTA